MLAAKRRTGWFSRFPGAPRGLAALACLALGLVAALATPGQPARAQSGDALIVGGKAFTEQYVLAEITKQLLEKEGMSAQTRVGYSTVNMRQALLSGEADIAWDYTWTGYSVHHGYSDFLPADEILQLLRELDADNGLVWLERSRVNNTYALAVNLDFAAESCIHSLDDLAAAIRNGRDFQMASDQECHKREDCLLLLESTYDFRQSPELIDVMNVAETYEALRERRAEVAVVYTTDGKIPAYDLELLEDPEGVFKDYFLVPVVRAAALREQPRLREVLERLARIYDTETAQNLHYRVDVIGQPVEQVARFFITSKGL